MKICPKCNAEYDYEMSFCLQDGTALVVSNPTSEVTQTLENKQNYPTSEQTLQMSEKTLLIPEQNQVPTEKLNFADTEETRLRTGGIKPVPPTVEPNFETSANQSKSKSGLLIAAILGILALFGIGIGGFMFLQGLGNGDVALANSNKPNTNASNTNYSNSETGNLSGGANSNSALPANANVNAKPSPTTSATQTNSNKPTPKPTEEEKETPTPKPTATPTPATPTPTPTPIPTPSPRPTRQPPGRINGGIMNGKAVSLVKPPYPPAAKAVGASGAVTVQVLIDENGNVVSARATNGHPLLRDSAESAARASKFSPTMVGGQSVKVSGVIVYNFRN